MREVIGRLALLQLLLVTVSAAPAAAQLANAVPAALGMSDNYTAVARGYAAVSWNPAALGLTGPRASGTIGPLRALGGMGPVTLADLKTWEGEAVPLHVREQWLADIRREGGQAGAAGFDFTIAAFHAGRFAAQISTSGRTLNDIAPGVAELILIGNADEQGTLSDIELGGSTFDSNVYSTGALSFGLPIPLQGGGSRLALGVTAKFTIGHILGVTSESVGRATAEPGSLRLSFPLAYTPVVYDGTRYHIRAGGGFGLDLGAGYERGRLTLAAVAQNVVNDFEWDASRLRYRPLELVFTDGTVDTAVDWEPLSAAPAGLRARVEDATFRPSLALGAALAWSAQLLLAADARFGSYGGMATRPPRHVGAGVQLRPLPWLPLQAGAAYVGVGEDRSGFQYSGGAGLQLGTFLISASATRRDVGLGQENMLMISLLNHTF
jgi:hypothetical protein